MRNERFSFLQDRKQEIILELEGIESELEILYSEQLEFQNTHDDDVYEDLPTLNETHTKLIEDKKYL